MAANVRCTNANVWKDGALRTCGWKGERFPVVSARIAPEDEAAAVDRAAVRKPCPRCGGRVEIINPVAFPHPAERSPA